MIEIIQAVILGIVEGLTEFLPISSTGHLIVAEEVLGYQDVAELFTVVIQLGAIAAVIWHYRKDLFSKFRGLLNKDKQVISFWKKWVVATIPAGVVGLLANEILGELTAPLVVAVSLIVGGLIMLLIETKHRQVDPKKTPQFDKLTLKQSIQIGCYQVVAIIPGVSRSGSTIMGGLLSGVDRVTATAFSFYLSIPILVAAGFFKLLKDGDKIHLISGGSSALLVGVLCSFVSGLMVIKWLLYYVSNHSFKAFAVYRIVFGLFLLATVARW